MAEPIKVQNDEQQNVAVMTDEDLVSRLKALFLISEKKRRKYDWQWYMDINFVRGEHYLRYNKITNRIEIPPNLRGKSRVRINLTYAIIRAVRRFVTEFRPRWEIGPYELFKGDVNKPEDSDKYKEMVQKTSDYADFMYHNIRLKDGTRGLARLQKEYVYDGLLASVGYPMIYFDEETGEITADTRDPFDVYVLDWQMHFHDNPIIWLVSQKYISEIKSNPNYENTENLKADNKVTQSQVKQMLHEKRYTSDNDRETQDDHVSTALVKEAYMLVSITDDILKKIGEMGYDEETMEMLKKANEEGEKRLRVVSYTDSNSKPIEDKFVDDDEYPIGIFSADVNSRETLGEGWVKNLRPLNQIINRMESGSLDWMNAGLKYKLVLDSNADVDTITTDHGEIITTAPGARAPMQLTQHPLPTAYSTKPDQYWRYMQTIGGSHDQFLGQGGGAGESGRHVEAIRAGDAQNLADLRDNNEEVLIWMMKRILKLTSKHYASKELIEIKDSSGNIKRFYVRGDEAGKAIKADENKEQESEKNVLTIGKENSVKVDIGSWLSQTLSAKQDFLLELHERQIIASEDVLEHIEYGDVQGALRRVREEIASGIVRGKNGGQPMAPGQPIPGEQPMAPGESEQAAEVENEAIMAGEMVPPTPPNLVTSEHIQIHMMLAESGKLSPKKKGYLKAHLEADQNNLTTNT